MVPMKCAFGLVIVLAALSATASATVLHVPVADMIHPITDEFIGRALTEAEAIKADAVVIELSTPGGLDDSTRAIVEKIFRSRVPVIVYVSPSGARAASAGFFML